MPEKTTRTLKTIERKYRDDIRKLNLYWPAESISLQEASEGRTRIKLQNGMTHDFAEDELYRLLSLVPSFLWSEIHIPLLVRYETVGTVSYYRVMGGRWQRRLAEMMLTGKYSYEGKEKLKISEFQSILRKYKSLVFVALSV